MDSGLARATKPARSKDGRSIVFRGNRAMFGGSGPRWALVPQDVWMMQSDCEQRQVGCGASLQLLVPGVFDLTGMAWSPDDRWLAFDGAMPGGERGIWLREMSTGRLTQALRGDYVLPTWSPDGKRMVTIGPLAGRSQQDLFRDGNALYILDVSEVVDK